MSSDREPSSSARSKCTRCGLAVIIAWDEPMCGCTIEAVRRQHGDEAASDLQRRLYGGIEYRVKWRNASGRQVKRFSNPDSAYDFVILLSTSTEATEIRLQGRPVGPWTDISTNQDSESNGMCVVDSAAD